MKWFAVAFALALSACEMHDSIVRVSISNPTPDAVAVNVFRHLEAQIPSGQSAAFWGHFQDTTLLCLVTYPAAEVIYPMRIPDVNDFAFAIPPSP